ncbi:ribonuclease Oy-like isoform X1 [Corticium candelabrum]|uniref:ribonuclease Oy-like isoform X1 n=1 Tax=Corticium candelabrum TaxID=121492 RepID=UPI002E261D4F|nr:ribonuclease Oy-like isoform X1 [Corticium candelabrum]
MKTTICLYLLSFLFLCAYHCNGKPSSFDFFLFAQEWPPAICTANPDDGCRVPPSWNSDARWTIHGLWPAVDNARGPSYCNSSYKFNVNSVKDLLPELKYVWPSVFADSSDNNFWSYEWRKHGTCAMSVDFLNDEHDFFETAISIHKSFNIYNALVNTGIVPSETNTYDVDEISFAITAAYGVEPMLLCESNESIGQFLSEIHLCMDKTLQLIDCGSFVYVYSACHPEESVKYITSF